MRMRSENELSASVGFISNDLMTVHTTTSDSQLEPVNLGSQTVFALCLCLTTPSASCIYFPHILPAFPRGLLWHKCHTAVCSGEVIVCSPLLQFSSLSSCVFFCFCFFCLFLLVMIICITAFCYCVDAHKHGCFYSSLSAGRKRS